MNNSANKKPGAFNDHQYQTQQHQKHLPAHLREQIQEANKLEFPEAQFAFKDIPFPNVNQYKQRMADLKN